MFADRESLARCFYEWQKSAEIVRKNRKYEKKAKNVERKDIAAVQMAKGEFSVKSCQEISISSRPEIQLAGNPSYFAVFSVIRLLIFEKWAKQHFRPLPVHSPSAQRTDNTNLNTTVDSIQVSKIVNLGLRSVFKIIYEIRFQHSELCAKTLNSLLNILQGYHPESLRNEPAETIEPLFDLLMEMATYRIQENTTHDSEYSLTAISYSCLLSLVIGIGDTGKILVAIATLIKCSKTLTSQNVKVPVILRVLQKSVLDVITRNDPDNHCSDKNMWSETGITESSLLESFLVRMPFDTYPGRHLPKSITSDGQYLYILTTRGLFKVGSGYGETIRGHVYVWQPEFYANDKSWIGFCLNNIYLRRIGTQSSSELLVIDRQSLRVLKSTLLLEIADATSNVIFTDRDHLGTIIPMKENGFAVRILNPKTNPASLIRELTLKLSRKYTNSYGVAAYDILEMASNSLMVTSRILDDIQSVFTGKDFGLLLTVSGKVYYCGNGSSLGFKNTTPGHQNEKWTELVVAKNTKIVQIAVGNEGNHVIFLTEDGTVYFCGQSRRGEDCDSAAIKARKPTKAVKPKKVARVDVHSVTFVACNSGSTALVTKYGEVLIFGKDTAFCDYSTGLVTGLKGEKIRKIALGKAHAVALNDKGNVFTFGINNKNQCGREFNLLPTHLEEPLPEVGSSNNSNNICMNYDYDIDDAFEEKNYDERICDEFFPEFCAYNQHVWGEEECMICTVCKKCTGYSYDCLASKKRERKPGEVCGCGLGDSGCTECGLCRTCAQAICTSSDFLSRQASSSNDNVESKKNKSNVEKTVIDNLSNSLMSIILSKDITIGKSRRKLTNSTNKHQIDLKKNEMDFEKETVKASVISPGLLRLPIDSAVVDVACGLHHTVVLLKNGQVMTFGSNQYGQLGCGDIVPHTSVKLVKLPHAAVQVAAGNNHTVILTNKGEVYTMGSNCKDQLAREFVDSGSDTVVNDGKNPWYSFPGIVNGFGCHLGRKVSWIGASADLTFLIVDESLISVPNLAKSTVLSSKSHLIIVPNQENEALFKCLVINKADGSSKSYTDNNQVLFTNKIACMDPLYNVIWSYDAACDEVSCYNSIANSIRRATDFQDGEMLTETDIFQQNCNLNRKPYDFTTILKAEITLPVEASGYLTRSHTSMFLLCCLDTLNAYYDVSSELCYKTGEEGLCDGPNVNYTKDDYKSINRFDSHGGGWGYSGHSVEAVRFMCDTNIMLGGFGVFGGRGVYTAKLKLFDLGPNGGDQENDGELIAETDDVPFDCPPRQKHSLLFNEPILLHSQNWYVAWVKISGPSSDCGSSGRASITTDDHITFYFKTSKKANNGTDINAGQIPQILYRLISTLETQKLKPGPKPLPFEDNFLSRSFSRNISKEAFQSLVSLLQYSWNAIKMILLETTTSQYLNSMLELKRLTYIGQSSLRLLRTFVILTYPQVDVGSSENGAVHENDQLVECISEVKNLLKHILMDGGMPKCVSEKKPPKKRIVKINEIYVKMVTTVLDECRNTFVTCFGVFYPTDFLKWNCLCLALESKDIKNVAEKQDLFLTAILCSLCSPSIRLRNAIPLENVAQDANSFDIGVTPLRNTRGQNVPYPVLAEYMTKKDYSNDSDMLVNWSWSEVFDRLLTLITDPVKSCILKAKTTITSSTLTEYCCNLVVKVILELIYQFHTVSNEVEVSFGQTLHTTPSRFLKINQSKCWNTGNGSPDAICFQVDKPGIVIAGCTVYGGFGNFAYEIDLLDNYFLKSLHMDNPSQSQRWTLLETGKGTFSTEDYVDGIVELKLNKPVQIKENIKYALRVRINGNRTSNGDCGQSSIKGLDDTVFKFSTCTLSFNGTTQLRGQIPSILYYSNPVDDVSIENEKVQVEAQIRKVVLSITNKITRSFNDVLLDVNTKGDDNFEFINELLSNSDIVTKLLPLVIVQTTPLILSDAKFAVQLLESIQEVITNVANINQMAIVTIDNIGSMSQTIDSFSMETSNITTSQYYTWVQSDHPYKPATVYNYRVVFPSNVKWFSLEFDPACCTSQTEDCLRIFIPCYELYGTNYGKSENETSKQPYWPVLSRFSLGEWPQACTILPGNEVIFSLETASDYVKNDKVNANNWGFRCLCIGYENPIGNMVTGTNNNNKLAVHLNGLKYLEVELAFIAGMCASNLMRKDISLPQLKDDTCDPEVVEMIADEISKSHSTLLSKGLSLNQFPTIYQALDGHLAYRGHSNESLFLKNFINCTLGTSGNRLAQWLQPESRLDLRNSEIVYNLDEFRCDWPSTILVRTKDQYNDIVQIDDLKLRVYAVPIDSNNMEYENGWHRFGSFELPNLSTPYEPTIKDKMCFYSITMMKEYQDYSFEELRVATLCTKKSIENTTIEANFDGTYTVTWVPKLATSYTLIFKADDQLMEKVSHVEVKDLPKGIVPPMHTSSNALKKTSKSSVNNKIRKFVMKYSSGLRIRTHPTLQSEQIGLVPVDGIITFIDEIHNDDGVWLRLSTDSIKKYYHITGSINEAWCLQFNKHTSKTLLVAIDEDCYPNEAHKTILRKLPDVHERKKLTTPFPNPAGYKVVKCGPSGHNVWLEPSLNSTSIGTLFLGNVVTIIDHVVNDDGSWVQLDRTTKLRYDFNECHDAWSLAVDDNNLLYLQNVEDVHGDIVTNVEIPGTPKKERRFNRSARSLKLNNEKLSVKISNDNFQIYSTIESGDDSVSNRFLNKFHVFENQNDEILIPDNYKSLPKKPVARNNKVKKAISASIAECVRAVFAAFIWHEGLVHDAMASATYLKFHPSLLKKESQKTRKSDFGKDDKAKYRHSLEISTNNDNLLKLPQPETLKVLSKLAISHDSESNLPMALKSLLFLWNELSTNCLQIIRQQAQNQIFVQTAANFPRFCGDGNEVFLDDGILDARKASKSTKNWKLAFQNLVPDEPKSICDLCGEVVLTRISTHMRENHPGCREKTDNKGYNSKGYYTNGWSGVCGEGGTENYSWYLLCSKCRKMYMLRNNMLHDDHGDLLAAPIDSFNIPSPVSSSFNCDFHITIKNNAMFLLTLSSSFPNPNLNDSIGVSDDNNLSADFICSFSTVPPCNCLKTFGVTDETVGSVTNSSHSTIVDCSSLNDKYIRPASEICNEGLMKNQKFHRSISMCTNGNFLNNSCDNYKAKVTCSNNNFINDSGLFLLGNPSNNLQKVMLNYSRIYKISQSPVLNFVYETHDLDSLHTAMVQSLRKAICRIYATQVFNWLLNTVTQAVSIHDILWWLVISLTYPRRENDTVDHDNQARKLKLDIENDLKIPDHPLSDLKMAGYVKKVFPQNFHKLLQTISDLMIIMPMGSALQQMAVRCWGLKFNPEDHNFLHQSHVFSIISNILSRSDDVDDCLGMSSSMIENMPQEYPILEKLKDITHGVEIKTSSRPNLVGNLVDSSTETFWESGDDDTNKAKIITITVPNSYLVYYVCVHVDNSRDPVNKVACITYLSGRNVDELTKIKSIEVANNIGGWLNCPMTYAFNTNMIRIELKGPDPTLRVRQIRILGEITGDSLKIGKQLSAAEIQQRNCEAETLRVFRLITSQVFEKLIKKDLHITISNNNNNNGSRSEGDSGNLSISDSFERLDDNNDLKEHMVGILFSRSKLTHLQKQIIVHVVQTIRQETQNLREEWESQVLLADIERKPSTNTLIDTSCNLSPDVKSLDSYCFEMLSLVLALSGSEIGRTYLSNQLVLISDLLTLLHVGSARVQRQVIALLHRIMSKISPESFAKILDVDRIPNFDFSSFNVADKSAETVDTHRPGLLDILLAVIAKALILQIKNGKEHKNRNVKVVKLINITSSLCKPKELTSKHWWIYGEASKKLADDVIGLIHEITSGKLSEPWMNVAKGAIAENLLNLTRLTTEERSFENLINSSKLWLALSSLCVMTQDHVDNLSSIQWKKQNQPVSRPLCCNHDDGETNAIIQCDNCGSLCADCDRFLHLNKRTRSHLRKVCKEEEESIKIELHEGCGRIKLFWLLALADPKTLKALFEYRDTSHNLKVLPGQNGVCRFCGARTKLGLSEIDNVCSDSDCQYYEEIACQRTHGCCHPCGGVKDELVCLPCLHKCSSDTKLLQDADDMCMICFISALSSAPSIQLKCGHIFHYLCCRTVLEKRWNGRRITFTFSLCPICKTSIDHEALSYLLEPIHRLYADVKRKALMRLSYEGDTVPTDPDEAINYAIGKYAYYVCSGCDKAYYGGDVRCEVDDNDCFDRAELVCGACSDISKAQMCAKHGTDFLEYKCRYCCSVAVFFCFGTTHFCSACHDDFQRITSIPQNELPQCPAGPKTTKIDSDECPLHVKHPITGTEFALGCGVCRNAQTF